MNFQGRFFYHFHPVGQGLFSTGAVCRDSENERRFLWVYDCGTSSSQSLIDHGIQRLKQFAGDLERIDLLALSHFDHDHISGVVRLVGNFNIGALILPYMPLAQRLIVAFEEGSGGADDDLTSFYLNPVTFLLAQDGPGIERIIFVPPSGNEGPPYPEDVIEPSELGPDDEPKISFATDWPEDADDAVWLEQAGQQKSISVEFLRPGSSITLPAHLWEFVPYNDDAQTEITDDFTKQVHQERSNLLSAGTDKMRNDALKKLKRAYNDHFGASSEERNFISLFLYCGPIYPNWKSFWLTAGRPLSGALPWRWRRWPSPDMHWWAFREPLEEPSLPRCSILYSGDGYLDTRERLQKLIEFLHDIRVQRIGVFQVMHHGARANWHQGIANAIAPYFSVFSSDPEHRRYKHPHAEVIRDFWRFGATQVDKTNDFNVYGYLEKQ